MPTKGRKMPPGHLAKMIAARKAAIKPFEERYWAKVDKRGPGECWPWTGSLHGDGYGLIWDGKRKCDRAHRVAWQLAGHELPPSAIRGDRLVLDHLCKNRACQNPAHLRLTTQKVNTTENSNSVYAKNAQKTVCHKGHPLEGANLAIGPSRFQQSPGWLATTRICLTCHPRMWMYAVIERAGPPKAKAKWRGPFTPEPPKEAK